MTKNAWYLHTAYLIRRGGLPAWFGLLALALASFFYVFEILPTVDLLAQLRLRQVAVQEQLAKPQGTVVLTPAQQLSSFYNDFPPGSDVSEVLSRVWQIANEQQLTLELGEYAMTHEQGARLDQLRITLPLKGSYSQVRKFAFEILRTQPALSLQSLTVRREKLAQDVVDARVILVLFLKNSS
jgi:hypothetical protein